MHVGLIIDGERLLRERALLERLAAGLIEQGSAVTAILPDAGSGDADGDFSGVARVTVPMKVPPWMKRARAGRLAEALEAGSPDLLHAFGDHAWPVGLDLARVIDRPLTLEVWSADQARRAPHHRSTAHLAGYVAPNEPIADLLRQRTEADLVAVVPLGIPVEPAREHPAPERGTPSVAIIGSGQDPAAYRAMLTGLSRIAKDAPQPQVCLELRGPCEHEIWRQARRLDLLGLISPIVDASLHRALLTGCDVLVIPERLGEVGSLVLEAMALGMPIVAAEDPYLDMLVADETAILVTHPDADEWATRLREVLDDADLAHRIGSAARDLVARRNRVPDQLSRLSSAYEQILRGGAHAFADAGA